MLLLVITFSLTFTSCGDDNDEPDAPSSQTTDTIKGSMGLQSSINIDFSYDYGAGCIILRSNANGTHVYVDSYDSKIVYIGEIQKLGSITTVPSSGWGTNAEIHNRGGYVICYVFNGVPEYIRLMLTTNKDATGTIVGLNYSYQHFTPHNHQ